MGSITQLKDTNYHNGCENRIQETHLNIRDRYYPRVKGWKMIFQANGPKNQAGIAILISKKIDLINQN